MTLMEEERRRQVALAFQEQILRKVTREQAGAGDGVRNGEKAVIPAAKGMRAGAEEGADGQKIASSSAAARAPEAAARGKAARTKPNRRENEFMMNLMILRNTLHRNAPECRERARRAGKYVWRDIRLLTRLVDKIQEAMMETMPPGRDEYYSAYARHGHYELRIDSPVRNARHVLISDINLAAICEAAMENECLMCMREGGEINQCPLREALLEVAPPTEVRESGWRQCEYRNAAGDLIHGREITV